MTPPALPAAPQKKRGCLMRAFLLLVSAFGVLILIAIIIPTPPKTEEPTNSVHGGQGSPATGDPAQAERRAARTKESEERRATAAANPPPVSSPPATPAASPEKTVPQQVEELARKEFGKLFEKALVTPEDGKDGWRIIVNIYDEDPSAWRLQRSIIKLAADCHPEGMTVTQFEVASWSSFTDGLGNTERLGLVRAKLRPEVAAKVNWKNKDLIDFHAAFETEFVHRAFKEKWASSAAF